MAQEVRKVGFIGLGDLVLPMAKNVVTKGYEEEFKRLGDSGVVR